MKTVARLYKEISSQIWASGIPENLAVSGVPGVLAPHAQHFQEGLADIAKFNRCEQTNVVDVVKFCNTFFKCGMTALSMPNGKVMRLSTVLETTDGHDYCSAIVYREVEWPEVECVGKAAIAAVGTVPEIAAQLALGFTRATDATDNQCGRALGGVWAKHQGNIYVAPWIQSTELIMMEWDGIKTAWADEDLVNEEQDYKLALQLYCQYAHERDYGSPEKAMFYKRGADGMGGYDHALAELIWTCEQKLQVRETFKCP